MISPRYAPAVAIMVAFALVPTLIHSYSDATIVDGLSASRISTQLGGYQGVPADRDETWGQRRFQSPDWFSRVYSQGGKALTLTVVRSLDAKSLYHHPELAVAYGNAFERVTSGRLKALPDVPVHVLNPGVGGQARAMYALHYDDGFVDDPMWFQLSNAFESLFSRRKPMTLFFVLDEAPEPGDDPDAWRAGALLVAAVRDFTSRP